MRYLVTGGAGFIGSHLIDALLARGDQVLVLDDLSTGRRSNIDHVLESDQLELVEGSMLDADLVDDCMQAVDGCFHLASAVGVKLVIDRPLDSIQRNMRGNDIVISTASRRGRRLLFTSTSEVYGKNDGDALAEESDRVLGSPLKTRWAYAMAKSLGESLAYAYYREDSLPMVVARLFNAVGPRQTGAYGMVLPCFVRQALGDEDVTVYGNGTQSRCFTHVLDSVQALVMLADSESATGRAFNIGCTAEVPVIELARLVIERTHSNSTVRLVPYEDAYGEGFEELGRRRPDTTALHELTGWEPTRTIADAIDDVISYQQNTSDVDETAAVAG